MESRQELSVESIKHSLVVLAMPEFDRPELASLRDDLEKAFRKIEELAEVQRRDTAAGYRAKQVAEAKAGLRRELVRLAELAGVVLEGVPGISDDVRVPLAKAKYEALIEAAKRSTKNIRPHLATLYKHGFPKDGIARIEAAAKALRAALDLPNTAVAVRSRATASLPDAIHRGRKIVDAIGATIKAEFFGDSVALHSWERASRIPGKPGRPRGKPVKSVNQDAPDIPASDASNRSGGGRSGRIRRA